YRTGLSREIARKKVEYMKKATVILGGGSARGLAHIGALEILQQHYEITSIIGTSIGAVVGGLYTNGLSPEKILETAESISTLEKLSFLNINVLKDGLINSKKLLKFFEDITEDASIEFSRLNFAAIAYDLNCQRSIVLDKGNLAQAMLASCSLPFVFQPCRINGNLFCDGGIEYPLPMEFARLFDKKQTVICVNVLPPVSAKPEFLVLNTQAEQSKNKLESAFYYGMKATELNQASLAVRSLERVEPNIYIHAYDPKLNPWDFDKVKNFYRLGLTSTEQAIENSKPNEMQAILYEIRESSREIIEHIKERMR
ncbi:MAG: patatin-like phospholipase family protein, partial [Candidatus Cloacimonetes bacterium]|nr:patatin-like phospholipase family protein [Candidatus Cloacimonadota bacterium]